MEAKGFAGTIPAMKLVRDETVILHHIDYGEADRIVTFFASRTGLQKGFAKAARKSRRRFGPALETFAQVRLHWTEPAHGELLRLREAELLDLRTGLRGSLESLALAGYGAELVETMLSGDSEPTPCFRLLTAFLDYLDAGGSPADARLLLELRVLALAGYAPHLLHCAACGDGLPEGDVRFDAGRGGSLCPACVPAAGTRAVNLLTLGTLARLLRGDPERFMDIRLSPRTLQEGGWALGDALALHLPRPLKSLRVLRQLGGNGPDSAGQGGTNRGLSP